MTGADCGFCHMPHKACAQFNKKQRALVKSMDFESLLELVLPFLLEKAESPGLSDLQLLSHFRMLAAFQKPSGGKKLSSNSEMKRLERSLCNTSLRVLLKMLFRVAAADQRSRPHAMELILDSIQQEVFGWEDVIHRQECRVPIPQNLLKRSQWVVHADESEGVILKQECSVPIPQTLLKRSQPTVHADSLDDDDQEVFYI